LPAHIFKKNNSRSPVGNAAVFLFLLLFGIFFLFPIFYAVVTAFKPMNEIFLFPPRLLARQPTFRNFLKLDWMLAGFWVPLSRYIFNSIFISTVGTAGHLLLSSMAAYPLAKHKFPGNGWIKKMVVWSLLFTPSVTALPQYITLSALKLINNQFSIILPAVQASLGLYLMINFMVTLPEEMLEAARIDGCSEKGIWCKIAMPNVKPAWLTLIIFSFQGLWASTGNTVYSEAFKPLPAVMAQIAGGGLARAGTAAAAAVLMLLPPLIIFVLSQNSIVETMSTSGLK
jgi:ABC-type glycerol-3-phosphate transport system permease component